jgi:site-specific DNA recombinase
MNKSSEIDPSAHAPTAVIYLRVSTSESANRGGEAEGYSIPIQRERSVTKAQELGAPVVEEFADPGKTATNMNRPGLQALLAFIEKQQPTYLIVYKLDRLSREMLDALIIDRTLGMAGTELISCTEHLDNSPAGKLQKNILRSMNQYHSDNLTDELKNKLIGKIRAGGTIGKAPIGYLNTIERNEGCEIRSVRIDEERGPLMQWAFESYATGEWSLSSLTDALHAQGLTTVPSRKYAKKPIPRSTLARLLRNPYYTGVLLWKGAVYPGNHPPLVSQEIFDAVQAVLDAHNVAGDKPQVHRHYLKGSVRCGTCGSMLCITRTVNRHGTEYLYFFCLGNYRRYTSCDQRAIPVELVEAHIENKWQAVRFDPTYAETMKQLFLDELSTYRARQERDKARALKRRIQLNEQRRKLLNAHYLDAIPLDLMREEQERITKEMTETEGQLVAAEMSIDKIESTVRRSLEFLTNCHTSYILASAQVRRQMNQAVFEAFFVTTDGALIGKPTEWFRRLLSADALQPVEAKQLGTSSLEVHDSSHWDGGVPSWLAELGKQKGWSSTNRSTPVFPGVGLNMNYLAEEVGFEPTVALRPQRFSRPSDSSALALLQVHFVTPCRPRPRFCPRTDGGLWRHGTPMVPAHGGRPSRLGDVRSPGPPARRGMRLPPIVHGVAVVRRDDRRRTESEGGRPRGPGSPPSPGVRG